MPGPGNRSRSGKPTRISKTRAAWESALADQLRGANVPGRPLEHYHKRTPADLEHEIQATFIGWVDFQTDPRLKLVYAIPNGGHRHPAVGKKMKKEGVRSGMPDLHLPVPIEPWASLYCEVKAPGEYPKKHQREKADELRAYGNVVAVARSFEELRDLFLAYLRGGVIDEQGRTTADR